MRDGRALCASCTDIECVLRAWLGIGRATVGDRAAVLDDLDRFGAGMDMADALHLARSRRAVAFVTCGRRRTRLGRRIR
ncbi:hypothetical protein CKO31_21750 [Thiohalocapsa halophila]|uniref:Uncharacterized protein n=1 Tax=Thiohalocapsa halophila TaxID=69359 RepID=A0ABS1CNR6_9GAMM|nr:hypothetical protein [Thiohalocapsa halophila]